MPRGLKLFVFFVVCSITTITLCANELYRAVSFYDGITRASALSLEGEFKRHQLNGNSSQIEERNFFLIHQKLYGTIHSPSRSLKTFMFWLEVSLPSIEVAAKLAGVQAVVVFSLAGVYEKFHEEVIQRSKTLEHVVLKIVFESLGNEESIVGEVREMAGSYSTVTLTRLDADDALACWFFYRIRSIGNEEAKNNEDEKRITVYGSTSRDRIYLSQTNGTLNCLYVSQNVGVMSSQGQTVKMGVKAWISRFKCPLVPAFRHFELYKNLVKHYGNEFAIREVKFKEPLGIWIITPLSSHFRDTPGQIFPKCAKGDLVTNVGVEGAELLWESMSFVPELSRAEESQNSFSVEKDGKS